MLKPWTEAIDPATIPDKVLASEWGRRRGAKTKNRRGGSGRPKIITACEFCGSRLGVVEMRKHKCEKEK